MKSDSTQLPVRSRAAAAVILAGRGKAARPGDRGVVAWVEGARDGSGLREVVAVGGLEAAFGSVDVRWAR